MTNAANNSSSDWISVKDRLPDLIENTTSKNVLVYRDCGEGTVPSIAVSFLWSESVQIEINGKKEIWNNQEPNGYRVTHWQPLPEPPKEKEND